LEPAAYGLVAWIGIKLTLGGFHTGHLIPVEMNEIVFWVGMLLIVVLGFVIRPKKSHGNSDGETQAAAEAFAAEMGTAPEENGLAQDDDERAELPAGPGRTED